MSALTTILVVDDECAIRDMLEEYLSKQGFEVCTADGGVAMRQIVSARKVDVVLLDIRMPGEMVSAWPGTSGSMRRWALSW